tara:strand:+ start:116 stop:781 length:666 start_codon:yes stop_codon:yes gene_type:complete
MKKCIKCNIEKELTEFSKAKCNKDGLQSKCKTCFKKYLKEYRKSNKEKIKEQKKEYYQANNERSKEYYQANKERSKELGKEWRQANKEYYKEWRQANKEKIKEYQNERRKVDPLFKMTQNLRSRTYQAFKNKGYSKNTKTKEMLGVDWEVCKAHIERQFTKGMTWRNYGDWHIDHIIPLGSANTEDRLKKLCHYSNLQPLWAVDNIIKSAKIDGQQNKFRF